MRLKFLISKAIGKMSAMSTSIEFPILDLPNELVALIIEQIKDLSILRRLAATCHRLQRLTEPVLWRKILLPHPSRLHKVLQAYGSRRERACALQTLRVPCNPAFRQNMAALARLIGEARNVRELLIESPSCNAPASDEFETEEVWQPMMDPLFYIFQTAADPGLLHQQPLQQLTKLTLHLNGPQSPYWTPDHRSLPIFMHPTLKYLKVSCVNFPDDLFGEITERAITPLQHLLLEECNISHQGLHGLLALPKGLQHLYLGENRHNVRTFENEVSACYNNLFRTNASTTVQALAQQRHSLRSLVYAAAGIHSLGNARYLHRLFQSSTGIDAGFATFNALESITLLGSCSAFERAVISSASPPNLRFLSYQGENPITSPQGSSRHAFRDEAARNHHLVSLLPFLRAPSASVPASLERLTVVYVRKVYQPISLSDEKRVHIHQTSKALTKIHHATLMINFVALGSFYPPYLHGEREPREQLVFDGNTGEFGRLDQIESDSSGTESEESD